MTNNIEPTDHTNDYKKVPVEVIDTLLETGVYGFELEEMLWLRRVTKDKEYARTTVSKIEGADLTGKNVYIYFPNYEDSEWLDCSGATKVEGDDGRYRLVYPDDYVKCHNGECDHNEEGNNPEECRYNYTEGINYSFYGHYLTVVTWEK